MLRRAFLATLFAGAVSPALAGNFSLFDRLPSGLDGQDFFGDSRSRRTKKNSGFFTEPAPRPAATGPVSILVSIATQTMTVSDAYGPIYTFDVSTGRKGYATPTGHYRPIRMHEMWYSSKYENSPMPWSIFFKGGYAIHGTEDIGHLGQRASHGCVRLDPANAQMLYDLVTSVGMKSASVTIV